MMEMQMAIVQPISKACDRVLATLAHGLEVEFGKGAGDALAHRFLEAEEIDFLWDARLEERWIGAFESADESDIDLDRVRIVGRLDDRWFMAVMIIDGEGEPHGIIGRRKFETRQMAMAAFADA